MDADEAFDEITVVHPPPAKDSAIAGLVAGMASSIVFCPIDVLRTRQAVHKPPIALQPLIRQMMRNEGISAFYGGMGATLVVGTWTKLGCLFHFL